MLYADKLNRINELMNGTRYVEWSLPGFGVIDSVYIETIGGDGAFRFRFWR